MYFFYIWRFATIFFYYLSFGTAYSTINFGSFRIVSNFLRIIPPGSKYRSLRKKHKSGQKPQSVINLVLSVFTVRCSLLTPPDIHPSNPIHPYTYSTTVLHPSKTVYFSFNLHSLIVFVSSLFCEFGFVERNGWKAGWVLCPIPILSSVGIGRPLRPDCSYTFFSATEIISWR